MPQLEDIVEQRTVLSEKDKRWLYHLVDEWALLADLCFADLILWVPDADDNIFWACAQVRPSNAATVLKDDVAGENISYDPESLVTVAYLTHEEASTSDNDITAGIPIDINAVPILSGDKCIAVLEFHTNQMVARLSGSLEENYLEAGRILVWMVMHHKYPIDDVRHLSWISPQVGDGIVRIMTDGMVSYVSPNALSTFRHLGVRYDMFGHQIENVVRNLLRQQRNPVPFPISSTFRGGSHEVELVTESASAAIRLVPLQYEDEPAGTLLLCRDTTEIRNRERQLVTKDATIREMHHRVKNHLQQVAALLRLQARRIDSPEAKQALDDAMKRVSAISIVHSILSQTYSETVAFDEVADRLFKMVSDAVAGGKVRIERVGSFGELDAEVATHLSMVITELAQNAAEHGFDFKSGTVTVTPTRKQGQLCVEVRNTGHPLPADFDLGSTESLGLSIVKTLVQDMGGDFSLLPEADGMTVARVTIPISG
ncbi:MAG: sensor histidine kinase [Propionibacteriaceae bacterium]|nr:sensor histidine kinase [Propionibacteriaceae bacterium]